MNDSTTSRNKERLLFFYKRNLDSNIECCTIILTEPTTPLIFMRNPVGLFHLWSVFMYQYPKQILTIAQQVQSYIDAGIFSQENCYSAN